MMESIKKIFALLDQDEKRRLVPLSIGVLLMSGLEVLGISSLGPFMAVVSDAQIIHRQPILSGLYSLGSFGSERGFLIALGIGAFALILFSTAFKLIVQYAIIRYAQDRRYSLSLKLFSRYLGQPYPYFLDHNTSELSKNILAEVNQVVDGVLRPALTVFSRGLLAVAIFGFLVVVNPWVAFASSGVLGMLYMVLYSIARPLLSRYGLEVREANRLRYKASSEAFGAIKDVKIMGKEGSFEDLFGSSAERFSKAQAARQILSTLPSHAMQSFSVGFAIALVVVMLSVHGAIVDVLPLLAIYAFAVQRLMPNLQSVYSGVTGIRYYSHTVDALYTDLTSLSLPLVKDPDVDPEVGQPLINFDHTIRIVDVSFSYPSSTTPVLREMDFSIKKNTTIGLVGTTGCGKTTLVDIVMGLLTPTSGSILVDDVQVSPSPEYRLRSWQDHFGYVPQHIYLADDSIASNIAFGVPEADRDFSSILRAAQVANLHEFVETQLPLGYETIVGERGVRLSGGQRQRVGIARALYHDPDIVVMDEATSALDSVTENAVMDAIRKLMHTKTIVIIAHRITTVQECDEIFLLDRGRIIDHGSYQRLISNNPGFRAMAKVATD